jgi:hypothetical protein
VEREYLPVFTKSGFRNADLVVRRIAEPRVSLDVQGRDRSLLKIVGKVLQKRIVSVEREFYRAHLLRGGPQDKTGGFQEVLAAAIEATLDDTEWQLSPARVRHLAKSCSAVNERGTLVANRLERIRTSELLLGPAAALFGFLLGSDGQTVAEAAEAVQKHWGRSLPTIDVDATAALEAELRDAIGDAEASARWVQVSRDLASGAYTEAIGHLIDQNRFVMKTRAGAAPWVDQRDGKLQVRFQDEGASSLPEAADVKSYWRHPYFLDSLRAIALQLRE